MINYIQKRKKKEWNYCRIESFVVGFKWIELGTRATTSVGVCSSRTNDDRRRLAVRLAPRYRSARASYMLAVQYLCARAGASSSSSSTGASLGRGGARRGGGSRDDCAARDRPRGRRDDERTPPSRGPECASSRTRGESRPAGRTPSAPPVGSRRPRSADSHRRRRRRATDAYTGRHTSIHTRGHVRPHPSRPQPFFFFFSSTVFVRPPPPPLTRTTSSSYPRSSTRPPTTIPCAGREAGVKRYIYIYIYAHFFFFLLRFAGRATDSPATRWTVMTDSTYSFPKDNNSTYDLCVMMLQC